MSTPFPSREGAGLIVLSLAWLKRQSIPETDVRASFAIAGRQDTP